MKKFIKNRDNNEISVLVENESAKNDKLVFVLHGLSGFKEQGHIRAMAEAFLENNYTVVSFDVVHTFGESKGGKFEDSTITNHYADLEDVVKWTSEQDWYSEPFVLCGHSLGGISTALFAEKYPEKVKALAPISTVVSGKLSLESKEDGNLDQWKKDGVKTSISHDGKREKTLKWSHMEDRLKYDLLPEADKLTMPVILIVGEDDDSTPPEHQQLLFDKLPDEKEIHIVGGAKHSFYQAQEQKEIKKLISEWIKKVDS